MKISLITVSFNAARTLQATINSIRSQKYQELEYIVVDGASQDATLEIIQNNTDTISRWISEPDQGIYDAMNKGIRMATGDIIGTLNSDDTFYDAGVLEKVAAVFEQHPEIDCLYGNLIFVNEDMKVVRKWKSRAFIPGLFAKSWTPAHPTFYCRREVFEKFGLYKTDYKIAADVELMLRVLEVGRVRSYFLDEVLVSMTPGGVSNSNLKSTWIITRELQKAFRENGLRFNLPKYLFHKGLKLKEFL